MINNIGDIGGIGKVEHKERDWKTFIVITMTLISLYLVTWLHDKPDTQALVVIVFLVFLAFMVYIVGGNKK